MKATSPNASPTITEYLKALNNIKAYKSIIENYSNKIKEDTEINGGNNIEEILLVKFLARISL